MELPRDPWMKGGTNTSLGLWHTRVFALLAGGRASSQKETWPPLKLLFLVLGNLDSCKQEGGSAVWETCTEYHCTPTKVFLKFSQSLRRPPTVATMAQAIQLAQGPIN